MTIYSVAGKRIDVEILDDAARSALLREFHGAPDEGLRKQWTARTWVLADGRVVVELYDRRGVLFHSRADLAAAGRVRFVKNMISFLKKNVSYKIELSIEEGERIAASRGVGRFDSLTDDLAGGAINIFRLPTGQLLLIEKSSYGRKATLYPDIKTLASENGEEIQDKFYGSKDEEYLMKKLASGDRLEDYDLDSHLIYPAYLDALIRNHQLSLVERKVYVSTFYGNLYRSAKGYYILVDEVNQPNGAGDRMPILNLRIYDSLPQVRRAQALYAQYKARPVHSEHFYQQISDKYGERFPQFVSRLADSLPSLLNFDRSLLSFDSVGMDLVDEAFLWNWADDGRFDRVFPCILAYYGQCYISVKHEGRWSMYLDSAAHVWVPVVTFADGSFAWDWIDFYKDLSEWPIPIRWAGDWERHRWKMRERIKGEAGQ